MLQLRVYGESEAMAAVAERIEHLSGAQHVTLSGTGRGPRAVVTADVRTEVADRAFAELGRLGVSPDDIVLTRMDTVGSISDDDESLVLVWADVLGQARLRARAPGRFFILMAAAGVVATFAIIDKSAVLIVGAMAISPDLLPITAACTGLVLGRPRLVSRGVGALAAGLAVTTAVAVVLTAALNLFDLLPDGFTPAVIPAEQSHVGASTILVALAAGVAGMLAVETRGSSAVGVAISVTTVPAVAYLGVAAGVGELSHGWSALGVLGANVGMMLAGGAGALFLQRALAERHRRL